MRIVSLLPSATEILCAIGGADDLIGRSHECDYPSSIDHLPILTAQRIPDGSSAQIDAEVRAQANAGALSLYALDEERLRELKPDLILTQDLCEVCSIDLATVREIARDMDPSPEILSLDPHVIFDVFDDLLRVGEATGHQQQAEHVMVELRGAYWSAIDFVNPYVPGPEVLFMEWIEPVFAGGHWTPGLIEKAGGRHSINAEGAKSRQVSSEEILACAPDRVIVCPCGLDIPRIEEELDALQRSEWWASIPAVSKGDPQAIVAVDGNAMFNRPGPRLVDAFCWLVGWLNNRPEIIPEGFPVRSIGPESEHPPA